MPIPAACIARTPPVRLNVMTIPRDDGAPSSAWLSSALEKSREWPHRSVQVLSASRIGVEHGMSGRIDRVVVDTERGGRRSLVVKHETAGAVERELLFRSECGDLIRGTIPDCYGGVVDGAAARGILLLEDIAPADQGDVLRGCTETRAEAVVRALARLHAASWREADAAFPARLPRWGFRPMDTDRWCERLARAGERFPELVTPAVAARFGDLSEKVAVAIDQLGKLPVSWIQVDAHLDNVLWLPDGSAVLLDWCNSAIGPPVTDLVRFLSEGVAAESTSALVHAYVAELQTRGIETGAAEVTVALSFALPCLVQSAVGWAGREDLPSHGRPARVCENWLRRVIGWVVADERRS